MQYQITYFETLESRRFLSAAPAIHASVAPTDVPEGQAAIEAGGDNLNGGPTGENGQGGPGDTGQSDAGAAAPASSAAKRSSVLSSFATRRAKGPANIVGSFSGTAKTGKSTIALTIAVASEGSDGSISGTVITGTSATAPTSAFTGRVHGQSVRFTFTQGTTAVNGTGTVSKDARTIRGSLTAVAAGRHGHKTHYKLVVTHA